MDTDKLQDNDSEYSLATNRSERSRHGHKRHRSHERGSRRHRNRGSGNELDDDYEGEKTVTIRTPPMDGRHDSRATEGTISVNIPEDDNWGETNTFISGTTDVTQLSHESLAKLTKDIEASIGFRDCGYVGTIIFALISYLSPIAFVVMPKFLWDNSSPLSACGTSCKGTLISMSFKLLILLVASWAIFFRRQRTSMPKVFMFRSLIMVFVLLITLTYWLFYGIWILEQKEKDFQSIIEFSDSMTNCLLFVHYLSLVLLELRHLQTTFVLEVIRTTDGERRFYNIGDLSIQRCSVWVLEKYYCDFPVYNPALMRIPSRNARMKHINNTFKVYDVDGKPGNDTQGQNRAILAAVARRRDAGHNERYYEEAEYERRVRKRRARLVAATEDAFTHIRKASEHEINTKGKSSNSVMESDAASEAIFPALARSLQKYLRTTRQHQHYQIDDIHKHLAFCIKNDMTPKAFLQRYINPGSYLTYDPRHDSSQWDLVSDEPLVNMLKDGTVFRLNQPEYSLVVTVRKSPRIGLQEVFIDPDSYRYVMHMQSETSV
ncbi:vang-like protein 2 isoform X1 [Ciona intestinalis]